MQSKKEWKSLLLFPLCILITIVSIVFGVYLFRRGNALGDLILFVTPVVNMILCGLLRSRRFDEPPADQETKPEDARDQKVQAAFIEKGKHTVHSGKQSHKAYYATFELAGGERYTFDRLDKAVFESLPPADKGVLMYDFIKESVIFKGFEPIQEDVSLPPPTVPLFINEAEDPPEKTEELTEESEELRKFKFSMKVLLVIALLPMIVLFALWIMKPILDDVSEFISLCFVILVPGVVILCLLLSEKRLSKIPEEEQTVRVINKDENKPFITFLFEGRHEVRMNVPDYIYTQLVVGDAGVLGFKKKKNKLVFVSFDRD